MVSRAFEYKDETNSTDSKNDLYCVSTENKPKTMYYTLEQIAWWNDSFAGLLFSLIDWLVHDVWWCSEIYPNTKHTKNCTTDDDVLGWAPKNTLQKLTMLEINQSFTQIYIIQYIC